MVAFLYKKQRVASVLATRSSLLHSLVYAVEHQGAV